MCFRRSSSLVSVRPTPLCGGIHGLDRSAVGIHRAAAPEAEAPRRRPGPSMARSSRCLARDSLGAPHRRALEGPAGALSAGPELPSALSAMVSRRNPRGGPPLPGSRPLRAGRDRRHRVFHRRHLRRGQEGGSCVGKTKRGKGTKIMAVADRTGLPVAACIASASPAEVTLVDETLDSGFLDVEPELLIGDKAYDSDPLDRHLFENFLGFVRLGCICILFRRL